MLRPLTESAHYVKAFHNAKPALRFLLALGLRPVRIFDSMLAEQLLSGGQMTTEPTLSESVQRLLKIEVPDQWRDSTTSVGLSRLDG